ncbi:MAG: VWA domain-containing protein [Candidatus Lokiarchaeota archaeon]|nr:VWA domain-containing protein [Candidatus Lokiarchaeota archaeon]
MSSETVEDTVLVLDVSRSMARRDVAPSRLLASKQALLEFSRKKLAASTQHKIGLVTFGEKGAKLLFLTNDLAKVEAGIEGTTIEGNVSYAGSAIAMGIQMHVDMLRQISGKVSRMLVFSDGRLSRNTAMDPLQMAKLAHGLGIHVDVVCVGEGSPEDTLGQVASITGGAFKNAADAADLPAIVDGLVKILPESTREYLKSKKPMLADLAGELVSEAELTPAQKELFGKMTEAERHKCLICFKSDCMVCKQPFAACGRHCPNCMYPLHGHCAAQWAMSDKKSGGSNVFRCPHCFYLIKVPASQALAVEDAAGGRPLRVAPPKAARPGAEAPAEAPVEAPAAPQPRGIDLAARVTPQEIGPDILATAVCPACGEPFEDEPFLYECPNLDCNALFHPKCFEKLAAGRGNLTCKRCGQVLRKVD